MFPVRSMFSWVVENRYVFLAVAMTCVISCGPGAPAGVSPARSSYAVDAEGRPAEVVERVTLRWPPGMPVGMIQEMVVCGSHAYVLVGLGMDGVSVVDLDRGERVGQIGRAGGGPGEFMEVRGLVAGACGEDRLYVVDGLRGVLVFDRSDGRYVKTHPLPDGLSPSLGNSSVFVAAEGGLLYVPGLWTSAGRYAYARKPKESMYEDSMLLWRLSLADGEGTRMVSPVAPGCFGDGSTCGGVLLDRAGGDAWVVAQAGGTRAAVLSADAERVLHVFDVRSPRFLRDDAIVNWGEGVEKAVAWRETNSTIGAPATPRCSSKSS